MQNSYCDHRNFDRVNQALVKYVQLVEPSEFVTSKSCSKTIIKRYSKKECSSLCM